MMGGASGSAPMQQQKQSGTQTVAQESLVPANRVSELDAVSIGGAHRESAARSCPMNRSRVTARRRNARGKRRIAR